MSSCPRCVVGDCAYGYENVRGRANHKGHKGYHAPRRVPWWHKSMALKKPSSTGVVPVDSGPCVDPSISAYWPTLWEYLSSDAWEDGTARQPSSLLMFVERGLVKFCLNDRALGQTAWATGTTVEDAANSLEKRLAEGSVEWRKSGPPPRRKS